MNIIDIHTHGIGGYDTQTSSADDILRIAEIHGKHGVTEIIPTIYSSSIERMRRNMLAVKTAIEEQKDKGTDSARIGGVHLEGPFLNPAQCGALAAHSFLQPNEYNLEELLDGFEDIVKIIALAPEMDGAVKLIKSISEKGIIVSMGHSNATYAEAESGFHAGARGIVHIFNAMRGIHHREPGLAGFGLMHKDIYIEIIADPFHLHQDIIGMIFTTKNPQKIILVSDSIKDVKTKSYSQGIKNKDNRLMGGSMTIAESAERLIRMGINKEIVLKSVSDNPARYLQMYL